MSQKNASKWSYKDSFLPLSVLANICLVYNLIRNIEEYKIHENSSQINFNNYDQDHRRLDGQSNCFNSAQFAVPTLLSIGLMGYLSFSYIYKKEQKIHEIIGKLHEKKYMDGTTDRSIEIVAKISSENSSVQTDVTIEASTSNNKDDKEGQTSSVPETPNITALVGGVKGKIIGDVVNRVQDFLLAKDDRDRANAFTGVAKIVGSPESAINTLYSSDNGSKNIKYSLREDYLTNHDRQREKGLPAINNLYAERRNLDDDSYKIDNDERQVLGDEESKV